MTPVFCRLNSVALTISILSILSSATSVPRSLAAPSILDTRNSNPLNINWDPAPPPEEGPPLSAGALRDPIYLPAQVGGIVGAYAISLVLVAVTLLSLAKRRRSHLHAADDEIDYAVEGHLSEPEYQKAVFFAEESNKATVPNFSYPSPIRTDFSIQPAPFVHHSPSSSIGAPGTDPFVDPRIVEADRVMAQQQLEEMYRHVMEHEDAKQRGVVLEAPVMPGAASDHRASTSDRSTRTTLSKKDRAKPASLNLAAANEEKSQSRTSSFLSALKSPRKKNMKGVSISSPIMTPQSSTFPRQETQELNPMPPRHYAPAAPPPVPALHAPGLSSNAQQAGLTPDASPESVQSIDERLGTQLEQRNFTARVPSQAPTEADPESAVSEHSQVPLVGLPSSPKPGARFPTLPASPKPGATFQRPNAPSAVRTGGALPLRAYEPSMASPTNIAHTTKQTVFERKGPLSPTTGRTPATAGAVPYSPYQPFTPCMPMTPSLVTKEDRKRMKKMVPKTPTLEMVRSSEDIW